MLSTRSVGCLLVSGVLAMVGCASDEVARNDDSPVISQRTERTETSRTASARESDRRDARGSSTSMAFPTGDRDSSLVLLEASAPPQVRVGEPFEYNLKVTNISKQPLHNVRVYQMAESEQATVQAGAQPIAAARPAGQQPNAIATAGSTNAAWVIPMLEPGQTQTRSFSGSADTIGAMSRCLSVAYEPAMCITTNVVKPELEITKEGPTQVLQCDGITYTYVVANTGTGTARNVILRDELPEGLVAANNQRVVEQRIGDLRQGERKQVTAEIKPQRPGQYTSRAMASSGDLRVQTRELTTQVIKPQLEVDVSGPEAEYVNQAVTYNVTVRNRGNGPARDARLELSAPGAGERLAARDIGVLEAGQERTIPITTRAGRNAGNLVLTATAEAYCSDQVADNHSVQIRTIPALQLEVVDANDPVRVGQNTTYSIRVINEGSGDSSNIGLTATLPENMQYVGARGDSNVTAEGRTLRFAPVRSLAPGKAAEWIVEVKAAGVGDTPFRVELKSDDMDRPAIEEEPTKLYSGDAVADEPVQAK